MSTLNNEIRWRAVVSLVFLDLAILISWLAYHEYQPSLLEKFRFTDIALPLTILQGIILFVTPPIAGLIADKMVRKGGNRLPVVSIGINFVSMVFMVVAVTIIAKEPSGIIRMLFPLMVALWLIAMNIFHSPAISSIEMFVPEAKLPIVIAIFAILADLIAATQPVLVDVIEYFGAPITFAAGGALVFGTGFWFTRAAKNLTVQGGEPLMAPNTGRKSNFLVVFLLGLMVGIATSCFFKYFPQWIDAQPKVLDMVGLEGKVFTSILIAVAALLTLPLGYLASKVGTTRMAIAAAILCAAILSGLQYSHGTPALILFCLFPIAFAAATVTFLPIAFSKLGKQHLVFGIGVFFSGVELLSSVVDIVQVYAATHP